MNTGRRERRQGGLFLLCFLLSLGALLGTANILQAQERTGTITGQTVNTYAVTTVKHKARKVSLGSVKFSLKADKSKTVVLKLSKASKKLLAAKRSLKVRITITLTSAGHRRTILHRTTTLRRKG